MGAIRAAVNDAAVTFMWMFLVSTVGMVSGAVTTLLNLKGSYYGSLFVVTVAIATVMFIVQKFAARIGGGSFNPTGTAAFYVAGYGVDSLYTMALRFPAQAIGAIAGTLAIKELMPTAHKHKLPGGPTLKVGQHTGALAEALMTFALTLSVLWIIIKGPANPFVRVWLLAMTTVSLIVAGGAYTGPSINPVNAFSWAYHQDRHNNWEHFYVYWISPFIGAAIAATIFRYVFPPPSANKAKKA